MKKALIIAGVFAGALLFVALFLVLQRRETVPEHQFQVKDTKKIRRIVFRRDTTLLELQKKDGVWQVNGHWKVRPRAVKALMKVLGEMEVRSPLSGKLLRQVLDDTTSIRTEVTVYGRLLPQKRFTVYLNSGIPGGNMMRLHGKKKWYILEVPGEDFNPATLFVTDPYYWRDLTLFHYLPGEVTGVELRYGDKTKKGFRAGIDTLTGSVIFIPFDTSLAGRPVDSGKVRRFLTYFQDLSADAWDHHTTGEQVDSILKEKPLYEVKVEAAGRKTFRMLVFPLRRKDRSTGKARMDPDVARAWVDPPGEMVLIKYFRIDPFLFTGEDLLLKQKDGSS